MTAIGVVFVSDRRQKSFLVGFIDVGGTDDLLPFQYIFEMNAILLAFRNKNKLHVIIVNGDQIYNDIVFCIPPRKTDA
jgi:hypothetical protein